MRESECCRHEQDISLLQNKIRDIHSQLMEQWQLNSEKDLEIDELRRRLQEEQWSQPQPSFGASFSDQTQKQNVAQINIQTVERVNLQLTKVDQLQANLTAMRAKVLSQVTLNASLKEQIRYIKASLNEEKRCSALLSQQLTESKLVEERLRKQCIVLQQQKSNIIARFQQQKMRSRIFQEQMSNKSSRLAMEQPVRQIQNQQRQIESLKYQIEKLNKNVQIRDAQFSRERKKKRDFEQTKMLIKRLEETQNSFRKLKNN